MVHVMAYLLSPLQPPPAPSGSSYSAANHPCTPTPSSSAAVEVVAGSPSTPSSSSVFPAAHSLDCSTAFLPQALSEFVGTSSFSLSDSALNGEKLNDATLREPVVCLWDNCQQEFPSLSSLVTHLDRAHTLAMTQFVCLWENCSRNLKPFDARYKLITHLRCHTGEKPYRCEVLSCKRSFSRLENLKLHTRTHTGEKPYQCDYTGCTKKFNNTSDRAKHKKTHVTRKPYACKYPGCGKSYTDPSSMRKHIKYTHKLKEEAERTGLPLLTLPKRKRGSASSSSSSSSSSSTPYTPKHPPVILQSPQSISTALQDSLIPLTTHSPAYRSTAQSAAVSTTQPQLIPMVKIGGAVQQGAQPVLLPTSYQQPPVMMILANSSSPTANWVTVAPTPSSSVQLQSTSTVTTLTHHDKGSGGAVMELPSSNVQVRSQALNPSSSSSVEDHLRLQIAHLQQQLYQSQLAAAMATQRQQPENSIQALRTAKAEEAGGHTLVNVQQLQGAVLTQNSQQLHKITKQLHGVVSTGHSTQPSRKQGPMLVASPTSATVVEGEKASAAVQPQYIPIPILQSQDVTPPTQYLYMSP